MTPRKTFLAALLIAALGSSGCSTVGRLNPFDKKDKGPSELASEGPRISIVAADQLLEPAAARTCFISSIGRTSAQLEGASAICGHSRAIASASARSLASTMK